MQGHKADVSISPTTPQEAKDNTPVNRRLNRIIRIKRSLEKLKDLKDKAKRDVLEAELKSHLEEFKANSVALKFLEDLDK
jgi:hypothetical protein